MDWVAAGIEAEIIAGDVPAGAELIGDMGGIEAATDQLAERFLTENELVDAETLRAWRDQAGQEVEEEKAMGRRLLVERKGATKAELVDRRIDVGVGTLFSNVVMYFIILTCAVTLHRSGHTNITTTKDAAEALRRWGRFMVRVATWSATS